MAVETSDKQSVVFLPSHCGWSLLLCDITLLADLSSLLRPLHPLAPPTSRLLLPAPEKYTENANLHHLTAFLQVLSCCSRDKVTTSFLSYLFQLGHLFLLSCFIQHVRQQTVLYIHFIKHTKNVWKSKIFKTFSAVWWNNIHQHCCLFLLTSADISGSLTVTLSALVPFNSEVHFNTSAGLVEAHLIRGGELSGLFLGGQRHLVTGRQKCDDTPNCCLQVVTRLKQSCLFILCEEFYLFILV